MQLDEAKLVSAARRGDEQAAQALVEQCYEAIYAFLRRLAGSEADAADLTQRTFARVWGALARFEGRSSFRSWLHSIAYHVFLDWVRGNHRLESRPDFWWEERSDPRPGPDVQVAEADLAGSLYAEVDRLEPQIRGTVHLHYYQGLTLDETATALGIATSTVKHRLRTAIQQLQKAMSPGAAPMTNLSSRP